MQYSEGDQLNCYTTLTSTTLEFNMSHMFLTLLPSRLADI